MDIATIPKKYVYVQATEPSGVSEGALWYKTTDKVLYSYDGSSWNSVTPDQVPSTNLIYTGDGFDLSYVNGSTTEEEHELTAISSADLTGYDYLKISILAVQTCNDAGRNFMTLQTKYTGGSYGDAMPQKTTGDYSVSEILHYDFIHTLSQDEKDNGVQVKVKTRGTGTAGGFGTITNIQTVLTLMN